MRMKKGLGHVVPKTVIDVVISAIDGAYASANYRPEPILGEKAGQSAAHILNMIFR